MRRRRPETGDRRRGVVASLCALSAGELFAAVVPSASSPLGGAARAAIDFTPGPVVDITLALVEGRDKALLAGTLLEGAAANGAVAGALRRGHALLAAQGLLIGVGAATRHGAARAPTLGAGAAGGAAGAATLELLRRGRSPRADVAAAAGAAAAAGLARALVLRRRRRLDAKRAAIRLPDVARPAPAPPPGAELEVAGISPLLTPRERFYVTDTTLPCPRVDPAGWRLRVDGLVADPFELTLDELLALELEEHYATLICVHNPVGGDRIGTTRWTGVALGQLLSRARPDARATHVRAHSVDGFTADIPLALIADGRPALAAVGMHGEPLAAEHGFPARVLVPGLYGYDANVKWLARLELRAAGGDGSDPDYWSRRGWPADPAHVRTSARIDVPSHAARIAPGETVAAGVAWAPPAGIARVELSVDGGDWREAELGSELAPTAWRQWRFHWQASSGRHELRVRAYGRASRQPEDTAPPFPAGSGGLHAIRVVAGGGGPPQRLAAAGATAARRAALAAGGARAWYAGA